MAIAIFDKSSGQRLFAITEAQLEQLMDTLEEEDEHDHDYYIDAAVCDFLDGRVDAEVVEKLRAALPVPPAAEQQAAGPDDPVDDASASEDDAGAHPDEDAHNDNDNDGGDNDGGDDDEEETAVGGGFGDEMGEGIEIVWRTE